MQDHWRPPSPVLAQGVPRVVSSGALIGAGIPEERVKHYEQGIKDGGILMGVRPRSEEDAGYFESEWSKAGGTHVYR